MFLLMLLAKPIFVLLYSERWINSVPYFQILCLAGIAICLQGVNFTAVAAVGKSRIMFRWTIIKRGIGLCLIVGGLAVCGMRGLLIGMVVSAWFIYFVNAYLCDKYIGYKMLEQMRDFIPILAISILAIVISWFLSYFLSEFNIYFIAIIQFVTFVFIYWGGSVLFKMESYRYFKENLPLILGRFNKNRN